MYKSFYPYIIWHLSFALKDAGFETQLLRSGCIVYPVRYMTNLSCFWKALLGSGRNFLFFFFFFFFLKKKKLGVLYEFKK